MGLNSYGAISAHETRSLVSTHSTREPTCYPKPYFRSAMFLLSTTSSTGSLRLVSWVSLLLLDLLHSYAVISSLSSHLAHSRTPFLDILLIVPPLFHAAISDHLSENYSDSTHARARIELKRHTDGEKDKEEMDAQRDEIRGGGLGEREGTARLLRRFKNFIKVNLSFTCLLGSS